MPALSPIAAHDTTDFVNLRQQSFTEDQICTCESFDEKHQKKIEIVYLFFNSYLHWKQAHNGQPMLVLLDECTCVSVCVAVPVSVSVSMSMSIYLSVCLSVCLSVYMRARI